MARFIEQGVSNTFFPACRFGLALEQRLTHRTALSYELLYSRQGNMCYFSNPGLFDRLRTKSDYLLLPVSLRYKLKNSPVVLTPGIQLGYLIKYQVDFLPKNGHTNPDNPFLQRAEYGAFFGIGFRLGKHLFTEARYSQSLRSSLRSFVGVDPVTGLAVTKKSPERYNQMVSLSLTYYPFHRQ